MFAVLTDSRSGSHLLQTLLDSHPQLRCYGEILGLSRHEKNFFTLKPRQGCLVDYPNLIAGSRYAKGNDIPGVLQRLRSSHVIHLTRDITERAKSQLFYGKAKRVNRATRAAMAYKLHLPRSLDKHDPEILKKVVENFQQRRDRCLRLFTEEERSRWLEVTYEWLCGNQNIRKLPLEKSAVLCGYLGVDPLPLKTKLYKTRDFSDTKGK